MEEEKDEQRPLSTTCPKKEEEEEETGAPMASNPPGGAAAGTQPETELVPNHGTGGSFSNTDMAGKDDDHNNTNNKTLESSSSSVWLSVSCSSWYTTNAAEIQDQLETATRAIGSGLVAGTVVWMVLTVLLVPAGTTG